MVLTAEPQPRIYTSLITHYLSNCTDQLKTGCNLMKDQSKTKQVLIQELVSLRHRISELERSESELKRAKEVLKDSESKFQFLAENMADVVFAVDLNLMTTYVSPSIERLLGFTPQERMAQKADQQLTLKSQKLVFETLSEELGREKEKGSDPDRSKTLELEYYHKDGSIKNLLTYIRGIRDSEGNLTGFYGSSHDITERKRADEAFSREYSFSNAIIKNISEGLCVCHETTEYPFVKFTIWNHRMTEIMGYTMEEINRIGWYQTVYPDPELQAKAIERMNRMRQRKDLRSEEWEITRADGNKRVLNISTSVVESDDGVVHVLALMQDITDRKRAREALRVSETRYRLLAENARDVIWTVDMDMRLTYVSPSVTMVLGFTEEEAMARTVRQAYTQASFEKAMQVFAEEMAIESAGCGDPNRSRILELDLICKDGNTVTVEGNFCFLRDPTGKVIGVLSILRDIADRKRSEELLRESEEKHRSFIESLPIGLYRNTPGPQGRFIMANTALANLHGFDSVDEFLSQDVLDLYVDPAKRKEISAELVEKGFISGKEIMLKRKDGTPIWGSVTARAICDQEGKVVYFDGNVTDITDRKRMEEEIFTLSITDQLTGLYNRRGFLSLTGHLLKLSERNKSELLLFFADLDLLKYINDTLGHEEGDKALIEAANIFKENFRTSDVIARLGGDEFAVLAIGINRTSPEVFTARLQQLIDIRNNQENRKYKLSISMGCAYYDPESPCSIDDLIARADKLMYEQKQNKKGLLLQSAFL
jgi:diguanylate cyclase (GGDEF)-like protein/PAS domain S-box-containing protein